jgi:hypothetical protein
MNRPQTPPLTPRRTPPADLLRASPLGANLVVSLPSAAERPNERERSAARRRMVTCERMAIAERPSGVEKGDRRRAI